jgi:hypothetical protein
MEPPHDGQAVLALALVTLPAADGTVLTEAGQAL